jgi:hypothetical protein
VDGRFLVVAGNDSTTLAATQVVLNLSFPSAGPGAFGVALFDGDRDSGRWDVRKASAAAEPPQLELELRADPAGTGTGPVIKTWAAGDITFENNAWSGVSLPHDARALTPAGPDQRYAYSLRISAAAPDVDLGWNVFKVRSLGTVALPPQPFAFIGSIVFPGDLEVIYPSYPDLAGSPYDGTWRFKFRVPPGADSVTIFDGDMDYGDAACTYGDTDDRDSIDVPAFGAGAVPEGVASAGVACTGGSGIQTGLPADDSVGAPFRRVPRLPGSPPSGIVYRVVAPDGQTFLNRNPSGNREWEQFKIVKVFSPGAEACPADGFAGHDCEAMALPAGVWELQVDGMDLSNLNFLRLNFSIER